MDQWEERPWLLVTMTLLFVQPPSSTRLTRTLSSSSLPGENNPPHLFTEVAASDWSDGVLFQTWLSVTPPS